MQYVIKRNHDVIPFNGEKIRKAIEKASKECNEFLNEGQMEELIFSISKISDEPLTVEEIQDEVVDRLMKVNGKLAKIYQGYRAVRHAKRKQGEKIVAEIEGMVVGDLEKLTENANKDTRTISVGRDILAGISSKEYYLNYILPKRIAAAHNEFRIHIHDLDYLLFRETNCELVHLARMLKGGCKIGNACMDEPKTLEVAVGHTVQIIASVSSNTYGGCTIPYLDKTLTPYVRKTFKKHYETAINWMISGEDVEPTKEKLKSLCIDNETFFIADWTKIYDKLKSINEKCFRFAFSQTEDAVKQAMQGLEYEINSLSTVNG